MLLLSTVIIRRRPCFYGACLTKPSPQIIASERLAQAIATNSMTIKIATITGPIIGPAYFMHNSAALLLMRFVVSPML